MFWTSLHLMVIKWALEVVVPSISWVPAVGGVSIAEVSRSNVWKLSSGWLGNLGVVECTLVWVVFSVTWIPGMELVGGGEVSGADIWEGGLGESLSWAGFLREIKSLFDIGVNSSVAWIPLVLLVGIHWCSPANVINVWEFAQLNCTCIISSKTEYLEGIASNIIIHFIVIDVFGEHVIVGFNFVCQLGSRFWFFSFFVFFSLLFSNHVWKWSLMSNSKFIISLSNSFHLCLWSNHIFGLLNNWFFGSSSNSEFLILIFFSFIFFESL